MVTRTEELIHELEKRLEERVRKLETFAERQVERADGIRREIDALGKTVEALRELSGKVAGLEQRLSAKEKGVDRLWLVVAAAVGSLLTFLGQWMLSHSQK